jgi:hypothetical protein
MDMLGGSPQPESLPDLGSLQRYAQIPKQDVIVRRSKSSLSLPAVSVNVLNEPLEKGYFLLLQRGREANNRR